MKVHAYAVQIVLVCSFEGHCGGHDGHIFIVLFQCSSIIIVALLLFSSYDSSSLLSSSSMLLLFVLDKHFCSVVVQSSNHCGFGSALLQNTTCYYCSYLRSIIGILFLLSIFLLFTSSTWTSLFTISIINNVTINNLNTNL